MPPSTSNFESPSVAPVRADSAYSSSRCSRRCSAERLEQRGALVEGQLAQRRAADAAAVVQRGGHVDARARRSGRPPRRSRRRAAVRPRPAGRARNRRRSCSAEPSGPPKLELPTVRSVRMLPCRTAGMKAVSHQSWKPWPVLRPSSPRATFSRSSRGGANRSPSVACRCSAIASRTSSPTRSVERSGPIGCR